MAIEVKKISDLPEATSVQGDELLEMVQDGKNVKILAEELTIKKDELISILADKVDKVPDKQLSDRNFTREYDNKLYSLPDANYLEQMFNEKVDKEWGKGLIEPAPNDGKQYVRRNNAWVEAAVGGSGLNASLDGTTLYLSAEGDGGSLKTNLVGAILYMSDDGTDPAPAPEPSYSTFSYEFEVGGYVDLGGTFADYGVNEISPEPFGHFIDKIENNKTGILRAVGWSYSQEFGYSVGVIAENSDYLLTYDNNIELIIKDLNGEILSLTVPAENINSPIEGIVIFMTLISEEQFNMLPTSGRVFVDIVLETSPIPEPEIFSYKFEAEDSLNGAYGVSEIEAGYGIFGTFIENVENDKIGKVTSIAWDYDPDYGSHLTVITENSDHLLNNDYNITINISDQNGEIFSINLTPSDVWDMETGEVIIGYELWEEDFDLLPKSGIVFVDIILDPTVSIQPW